MINNYFITNSNELNVSHPYEYELLSRYIFEEKNNITIQEKIDYFIYCPIIFIPIPLYYIFGFSSKVAHLSSYIFYLLIIFISFKIIKLIFNIKIAQYSILILSLNNHLSNITRILYEDSIYIALILIIY